MPGKTNGKKTTQNGVNGSKEVEMKDDTKASKSGKGKKTKEGEEEMTVVVPPAKGSKLTAPPPTNGEDDIEMGDVDADDKKVEELVDPVTKTVAGE